jgi:WD40 repeat protein
LEAAFSSDGNLFSVGCPIKSAVGNNIFLWDLRTGGYLKFWHAEASIVFDQEGSILITYSRRTMKFWDVSTGNLITELYASDNIRQVEFSPDNKILAADYRSGIQFWELSSFKPLFHVSGTIDDYTFNPDWSKLAVVEYHWQNGQVNRTLKIYDMSTQQVFYSIQGGYTKTASAAQLISSPDGKIIVMKNFKSDSFDIMDFNSGAQLSRIQVPSWFYVPPYFTFNPDGRILAIPGYGSTVSLYAIKPSGP